MLSTEGLELKFDVVRKCCVFSKGIQDLCSNIRIGDGIKIYRGWLAKSAANNDRRHVEEKNEKKLMSSRDQELKGNTLV